VNELYGHLKPGKRRSVGMLRAAARRTPHQLKEFVAIARCWATKSLKLHLFNTSAASRTAEMRSSGRRNAA
jgi:hypothetical protein